MRFRREETASTLSVETIIYSRAVPGAFRKRKTTIAWPVRYWRLPERMEMMSKPSLNDQIRAATVKIIDVVNNKLGEDYLETADVGLRAQVYEKTVWWGAKISIRNFSLEADGLDPVMALRKLRILISKINFDSFPQR